ncbi:MAG: helix-turn-helix domain-containing protein [Candidatus Brocadiia bacterium]|jgi:excisionase family DNA binding protein
MACEICGCPEERWLRVSTVARQFRCSTKRVRRLIKRGEIDGVLFGGEWRVDHRSLDDYVRKDSVRFSVPGAAPKW